jgi:xanthine dehydrogenase accessory factor
VGTISGGCLERDVRDAAVHVMADGVARLLHFDLTADDEVVWGWGLGCNGVIDVFVEPSDSAAMAAESLRRAQAERRPVAVVLVVESSNARATASARLMAHADGTLEGSLGDRSLDDMAAEAARGAIEERRSGLASIGDAVHVFVEVVTPAPRLVVCGAGHDAAPLVRDADDLGWLVDVVDDRDGFLELSRFPSAARLVRSEPLDAASAVGPDDRTHVVVMSHNFLRDKDYLRSFLGTPVRYIGMLGPAARLDRILEALRREGVDPSPDDLLVVHGPAGLDLGGDGPDEVAWAIMAELLAVRNDRSGGPLRDRPGPIHGPARDREGIS